MYKLLNRKLKKMDEYEADELLDCNTYEAQRPIKPKHLKMLKDEMTNGTFLDGNVAIAILKYDNNRKVMVNGQHQCTAIRDLSYEIVVNFQEYEVNSSEDLSSLYQRFDNHQSRTLSDCLNTESLALGVEWKRKITRLVVSAACYREGLGNIAKVEKVKLLKKYLKQGGFVNHLLKDGISCKHMTRTAVIRSIIETYEKDKNFAESFWIKIRDGVGLIESDPELKLRNYLMTYSPSGINMNASSVSSTGEMYAKCVLAWNAKRKGVKTNLAYHSKTQEHPKIV